MAKYPKLTSSLLIKDYKGQTCKLCNVKEKAVAKVEIQTNYFRGDDDVFWVCDEHLKLAKNSEWKEFYKEIM